MWANYLVSLLLIQKSQSILLDELTIHGFNVDLFGPMKMDLQLLIGPNLAIYAENSISDFLKINEADLPGLMDDPLGEIDYSLFENGERIPEFYKASYYKLLNELLMTSRTVEDVLWSVFYAQRREIEIPSRETQLLNDRLDFGISFARLKEIVEKHIPDANEEAFTKSLDRMIDECCIVPRYINISNEKQPIWVRVFRVGEGSVPKLAHMLRLLFESLCKELRSTSVPKLLFEKFCVLALNVAKDQRNLTALQTLVPQIYKSFHLYGARCSFEGNSKEFLMDWAVTNNLLIINGHGGEESGAYELNHALYNRLYPKTESPFDKEIKNSVEDLAVFTKIIYQTAGLKSPALVGLTSVATPQELHSAVSAELDLWLHDKRYSVFNALAKLLELTDFEDKSLIPSDKLSEVNEFFIHTANFTAQVTEKTNISKKIDGYLSDIERRVRSSNVPSTAERIWGDLRITLDRRIRTESNTTGFEVIISILRIAYRTNGTLRDLLSFSGFEHPKAKPINQSVSLLIQQIKKECENQVVSTFFSYDENRVDILGKLEEAINLQLDNFAEVLRFLRIPLLEIAARCEEVLVLYGPDQHREPPEALDPPQYILMWDTRGSSSLPRREPLDTLISSANRKLSGTLHNIRDFKPQSLDDGNGFICKSFKEVLTAFYILTDTYKDTGFRAGCEVNLQGRLNYYSKTRELGGKAYEHAARICSMFKEISAAPASWTGADLPIEPDSSYLIVGEFARRYAEKEYKSKGERFEDISFNQVEPAGMFEARVKLALPIKVTILTPR
jgi:hypothetical protein